MMIIIILLLLILCLIIETSLSSLIESKKNIIVVKPLNNKYNNNSSQVYQCTIEFYDKIYNCSLGKNGVISHSLKTEGDGHTPTGIYPLRQVYYRSDKIDQPITSLNLKSLSPQDGWCDDSNDINYNKHVVLPYSASHEDLYRDDNLYNIIIVVGYNDNPVIPNKVNII